MPGENLIDICRQRHMPTVDAASIAGIVLICVNGTCHNTWASLVPQMVKNLPDRGLTPTSFPGLST